MRATVRSTTSRLSCPSKPNAQHKSRALKSVKLTLTAGALRIRATGIETEHGGSTLSRLQASPSC
jgi:hypothetical protein